MFNNKLQIHNVKNEMYVLIVIDYNTPYRNSTNLSLALLLINEWFSHLQIRYL